MLKEYQKKRDFKETSEPKPNISRAQDKKTIFVIQKHNATRLHFDFRIEHDGVLKSWAVPKGLSDNPGDKRLGVMVEDHPLSYAKFSGRIPKGQYGAGTVEIWDEGRFVNITVKNNAVVELGKAIDQGHFTIFMKGNKTNGTYGFTRIDDKNNWLIVKKKENEKRYSDTIVVNDVTIKISNPQKELDKGIIKYDLIDYYSKISKLMLPHIKGRLVSMLRFPDGVRGKKFFQKNAPDYFPDYLPIICIEDEKTEKNRSKVKDKDRKSNAISKADATCYTTVVNEEGIVYLGSQVVEMHTMINKSDGLPDKMVFDLDPDPLQKDLKVLKDATKTLRDLLRKIGFRPYIMTSGGKGYHVVVPIKQEFDNREVRDFASKIADILVKSNPKLTTELIKAKRHGRIFVDVNRNSSSQTSIAPYAARAREGLPIACPFEWDELINIDPQTYTINNYPKTDAWKDFYKKSVSMRDVIKKLKS